MRVFSSRGARGRLAGTLTRFGALALVLMAPTLVGCGGGANGRGGRTASSERSAGASAEVSDEAFAGALHDLLVSDPGSQERSVRLAGVVGRQMSRANARFHQKKTARALATVTGGLNLVRSGELKADTLGPNGRNAIREAVKELANRGDEGRAGALYEVLLGLTPAAEKPDVAAHLEALTAWTRDAVTGKKPMTAAGTVERIAVRRAFLEPSTRSREDASHATTEWLKRALSLRTAVQRSGQLPPRDEGQEAMRALQTGPATLASVHLRDLDATAAYGALEKADARELNAELSQALRDLSREASPARYLDTLQVLRPSAGRDAMQEEDDLAEEREIFRIVAFRVAQEAYRLDPTVPESAGALAAGLQEFGMAEASPAVLVEAAKAHPEPRALSGALAIAMQAMVSEVEAEDVDAARRAFRAAQPLLAVAQGKELLGKVQPSPARVRALMGDIELREGRLAEAQGHFQQAIALERTGASLLALARIEWHQQKVTEALEHLKQAITTTDVTRSASLRGEVLLLTSDIERERGNAQAAREPLKEALKILTAGRGVRDPDERARVERALARVLDRFGAAQPAQRALERALQATPRDKQQTAATAGQLIGRALVRGDLSGAREGLSRALAADLGNDDLVYYALWVRILERQARVPTDGTPGRILASIADDGRWVGRLAAFGAAKIKADELMAAAKTETQKTEALFYVAMDRRAAGDTKGAEEALRRVLAATGLELMEMGFARDILSGPRAQLGGPLPQDVQVP